MKLVYTFSTQFTSKVYNTNDPSKILTAYINYYRRSILSALEVGYKVDFYISSELIYNFKDLKINLITIEDIDSGLFDFWKAKVLKERTDDIMLVDGDIDFHKKISITNHDLIYDFACSTGEEGDDIKKDKTWHHYYKPYVNNLSDLGIKQVIPEWTGKRLDFVHNIGVLYFNNKKLKEIYVQRWFEFNDFINKHIFDKTPYTAIGAQYMLSEIINHYNCSSIEVTKGTYDHNLGIDKFTIPTVSTHEVQTDTKKSFL